MKWTAEETELARTMVKANAKNAEFVTALGRSKLTAKQRLDRVRYRGTLAKRTPPPMFHIPAEVLEERERRRLAPQRAFGDPPVGFSSLERRYSTVTA